MKIKLVLKSLNIKHKCFKTLIAFLVLVLPQPLISQISISPHFELIEGEHYFRINGKQTFLLGRNPVGTSAEAYEEHFHNISANGERIARIHFTYMPINESPGEISKDMLYVWDQVLDAAEKYEIAVLPVLDVWSNWNNGNGGVPIQWTYWNNNPFNTIALSPADLFNKTQCQNLWMQRLEKFIKHWSNRRAIIGWEIFSELDLVTGATEDQAVPFIERAAEMIRVNDPWKRPVTASLSGINDWPKLSKSSALDFLEIHPYASGGLNGQLDSVIISTVRQRLDLYMKPVLIGESGLSDSSPHLTLDVAPRARIGIQNAVWASVVSGAMNGRMLWWHDGYDLFEKVDISSQYQQVAAPVVEFVHAVGFNGFGPISCSLSDGLMGAMIGNGKSFLGWFRDIRCIPPNWPINKMVGQTVTIDVVGNYWQVEFFDTLTGKSIGKSRISPHGGRINIILPEFFGSIAIRLKQL